MSVLLLLFLVAQNVTAPPTTYSYAPKNCTADYYRFALLSLYGTFLIHGLWIEECAQCVSCGYPSSCDPTCDPAVYVRIAGQLPGLQQFWFPGTILPVQRNTLLGHEWCKHGTCTNLTALQYFNVSLAIYGQLVEDNYLALCNASAKQCFFLLDQRMRVTNKSFSTS